MIVRHRKIRLYKYTTAWKTEWWDQSFPNRVPPEIVEYIQNFMKHGTKIPNSPRNFTGNSCPAFGHTGVVLRAPSTAALLCSFSDVVCRDINQLFYEFLPWKKKVGKHWMREKVKLSVPWRHMEGVEAYSHSYLTSALKWSGKLHAPAVLPPRNANSVPIEQDAQLVSQLVWTLWRKQEISCAYRELNQVAQAVFQLPYRVRHPGTC